MLGGIRTMLSRMAALTATAIIAALSAVRVAFAAPEYTEMLRLAQEKVQAATQPGAFGNGTPGVSDPMAKLPWLGLAACAAAGAVIAAKIFTSRMRSGALTAQ